MHKQLKLKVTKVGHRAVVLEIMSIHTRKGKIMNTGPGTHMMQYRFEPICAEFETRIQTAVGERVGRLQTLTCNKEFENILKISQNTQ